METNEEKEAENKCPWTRHKAVNSLKYALQQDYEIHTSKSEIRGKASQLQHHFRSKLELSQISPQH